MSALLDTAAQTAALDAMLGDSASSTMPTAFELAMFDGDPRTGGAELTSDGGYGRVTGITNNSTNFPDAVDGAKTSATFTFPTSTGAQPTPGRYWVLIDASDHTTRSFFGPLTAPVIVGEAGVVVEITLPIYWNLGS